MKDLAWHVIDRHELADLLKSAGQVSAQAVGDTTVYRIVADSHELLAVALSDGNAVIVEKTATQVARRRRAADGSTAKPSAA